MRDLEMGVGDGGCRGVGGEVVGGEGEGIGYLVYFVK